MYLLVCWCSVKLSGNLCCWHFVQTAFDGQEGWLIHAEPIRHAAETGHRSSREWRNLLSSSYSNSSQLRKRMIQLYMLLCCQRHWCWSAVLWQWNHVTSSHLAEVSSRTETMICRWRQKYYIIMDLSSYLNWDADRVVCVLSVFIGFQLALLVMS